MKRKSNLLLFFILFLPATVFAAVNINTADKATLISLNGVGEVKAQAIIDYREADGPFRVIEDIMKVKGIGPATFAAIKSGITVGDVVPTEAHEKETKIQASATPIAPESGSAIWAYLLGLFAVTILGVAATLYARAAQPQEATKPLADEFEIVDA